MTATCIPAFFKCSVCTKAEGKSKTLSIDRISWIPSLAERPPQWSISSVLDDETTTSFLTTSTNSDKVSLFLSYSRRILNLREQLMELKLRSTPRLRSLQYALRYNRKTNNSSFPFLFRRCDDLVELFHSASIKSDQLMAKIEERKNNRQFYECVAHTINDLVDSICSSTSSRKRNVNRMENERISSDSSCLSLELTCENEKQSCSLNDQMNLLICHLSDDDQTRQIRLSIQNRYEQFLSTVEKQIQTILQEHQSKSQVNFFITEKYSLVFRSH